jgi:PAS domain S-box-containing protein
MPGVEIHANVVDALQRNLDVHFPAPLWSWSYNILPWLLAMLGFLFLSPSRSLLLTLGLAVAVCLTSLFSLSLGQVWLAPVIPLVGLVLCYPLWSWRRLEASMRYMVSEVDALTQEAKRFPGALPTEPVQREFNLDHVEAKIAQVQRATGRMSALRLFLENALRNQSDGLLVLDANGLVMLANPNAANYLGVTNHTTLRDAYLPDLLASWTRAQDGGWMEVLQQARSQRSVQCETRSPAGRDFLLSIAVTYSAQSHALGWVLNLTDITSLKESDQQRQELLNFLSHDMRAPQASILALLAQQPATVVQAEIATSIRGYAERTLHLASQFMQLAKAENLHAQQFSSVDMVALMHDAIDEIWPLAEQAGVRIERKIAMPEAWLNGDANLLCRALINLLSNAIKHSPRGGTVKCILARCDHGVCCAIHDQGAGIAAQDLPRLFQRFSRLDNAQDKAGAGLGLALVKMVAQKHGGQVEVSSSAELGSCFSILLPLIGDNL